MADTQEALLAAQQLTDVRRYQDARRKLADVFAEAPNDADAHVLAAAIAYDDQEDLPLVREHLSAALAASPNHRGALNIEIIVLMHEHRYAEAERRVIDMIRDTPQDPDLFATYARIMLLSGQIPKAKQLVAEARRLEPAHQEARIISALIGLVDADTRGAGEEVATLVRDDPEARDVAATLLAVLIQQHRYREALELSKELLRAEPGDTDVVDMVVELRARSHWLSWPLYPLKRWGMAGSIGLWGLLLVSVALLRPMPSLTAIIGLMYLAYVVYSWTYTPLMERWIRWRGIA